MTKQEIKAAAESFKANPAKYLSELKGTFTGQGYLNLARVLNAAGFYCRTLDTNRWTARWAQRLMDMRDDMDLCAELAELSLRSFR